MLSTIPPLFYHWRCLFQTSLYPVQRGCAALPAQRPNFNMFLSISFKALIGKLPNRISSRIVRPANTYISRPSDRLQLKNLQIHAFCARLTSWNKGSGRTNNLFQRPALGLEGLGWALCTELRPHHTISVLWLLPVQQMAVSQLLKRRNLMVWQLG